MAGVRDYAKLAVDIRDSVGEENIISATHCATRLRLVLKQSPAESVTKKISSMPGVIQVVEKGGQYQVVIGTHAKDVYEELTKVTKLDASAAPEIKQTIAERIIATMSAVFAPFVYILAAAGLIQGSLIIILQFAPEFSKTGTYEVLSFISWSPFTFLPALIAVTASKHFKCNTYIALWCCLALCNPSWGEIAGRIANGEDIKFLFFSMAQTTYTSTVLPPLFLVFVLSYLEKHVEKLLPDVFKAIFTPFICAAIMVPATIIVIGPLSASLANAIAAGLDYLSVNAPVVLAFIVGAFWQVLVIFGIHWASMPVILADFAVNGHDAFQAFQTCAVTAQAAACFGVFLKTKNAKTKNVAISAGVTGIFGITEPAIYGVNLPLKKPFIIGCIGGAAGAIVASLFGSVYYIYAGLPGLLTVVNAIGENPNSFTGLAIGMAVTIVSTIALIQIIGCDPKDAPEDEDQTSKNLTSAGDLAAEAEAKMNPVKSGDEITIFAPMNGEAVELSKVNDPTFAGGMLGQGMAIVPSEGKLYSPIDGEVSSIFETKHAITLTNPQGVEMLIHIGIDTVNLGGKYYTPKVKDGQKVKKGDLLIEFDVEKIKQQYETVTPILVVNPDAFSEITPTHSTGAVKVGEPLYKAVVK